MGKTFENLTWDDMCDLMCGGPEGEDMLEKIEKIKMYAEDILNIIQECEDLQDTGESEYTERCAKLSAYEAIKELIGI